MAYRGPAEERRSAPRGGLVEEVVQQFADRHAYARELVQNAIDAGATAISVRADASLEELTISVEDDGTGMSLETIEGSLLTLFASTKERAADAIGRYGVGFKSVLAIDPTLVVVETRHATGSFVVELRRDHTFEVKEGAPGGRTGTTVRLILTPDAAHVKELRRALYGWCRHVACPITLSVDGVREVVNTPFELGGPVVLEVKEGDVHVIVALDAPGSRAPHDPQGAFAGFYAHGLTLLETTSRDPVRAGVSFKVESRALACTISRDDVRRDKVFRAAMQIVDRAIEAHLPDALASKLELEASSAGALGAPSAAYLELAVVAARWLRPERISVPLIEARDGQTRRPLRDLREDARSRVFSSHVRSLLSAHVASLGHTVVLDTPDGSLSRALQLPLTKVGEAFLIASEVDAPRSVSVVLHLVGEILGAVLGHAIELVCVEDDRGARGPSSGIGAFVGDPIASNPRRWVLPASGAEEISRLLFPPSEALASLGRAVDPVRAAGLFARLVLVECTPRGVDARSNQLLLEHAARSAP